MVLDRPSLLTESRENNNDVGAHQATWRSTKALYKIIDTVLTFLSRCWIEFDTALKTLSQNNNYNNCTLLSHKPL